MARGRGAKNVLRGVLFALALVVAIVLVASYWSGVRHGIASAANYVGDNFPPQGTQRVAVIVYLLLAVLAAIAFSRAGHFRAYGIAIGLGSLLWFLFWEGFPPLGLHPSWTNSMDLRHLGPTPVVLWAIVAVLVITVVFVPLEIREIAKRRRDLLPDSA
ncbi:MAG TPA: hypothetical protein VFR11_10055 [Micromonosporaceae bacterium]|jgi:hypothetical protein|nr:hypothetical protein [Micromonosporaceae bacterium]